MKLKIPKLATLGLALVLISCNDNPKYPLLEEKEVVEEPVEKLVDDLKILRVETTVWRLEFNSLLGDNYQFNLLFKSPDGPVQRNRMAANKAISIGDTFFASEPGKDRFKLLEVTSRQTNTPTGTRSIPWASIEDLSEQRKGRKYELMLRPRPSEVRDSTQYEHMVFFHLDVPEQDTQEFQVFERTSFTLSSGGTEQRLKLVEVKFDSEDPSTRKATKVVVEFEDRGKTISRMIPVQQSTEE